MLIEDLRDRGYLKTPRIIEAFQRVVREDFIPREMRSRSELNAPLPIGYGQTISQPLTVAFMLELLDPSPGEYILDIGYGSGWTSALLAYCVSHDGSKGRVFAVERIPELCEFGAKNIAAYHFIEKGIVQTYCGDGSKGWPDMTVDPHLRDGFDKIIAAASAHKIPQAWKDQLTVGGRIIAPVGNSIWRIEKTSGGEYEEYEYPGFAFVPLIKN